MNAQEPSAAIPATDDDLLRRYAAHHDQQAFATLAARYVNFVYSTAVRQVHVPLSALPRRCTLLREIGTWTIKK